MSKRKQNDNDEDDESSSSDVGRLVDVDFEFFDPNPQIDYHALKRLLRQLFQADSELFHLHEFTELLLSQPLVGTTVKTDGRESDSLAFLTVLNVHVHRAHPSIKAIIEYSLLKSAPNTAFHTTLQSLVGPNSTSSNHVGLVLCERLINMPVQVIPPMYRMLASEIKWAIDDNEPYIFSHLLFISRTYRLTPEEEAAMQSASAHPTKRQKSFSTGGSGSSGPPKTNGVYSFHPEDEYIQKVAMYTQNYTFTSAEPRETTDAFGLDTGGRVMLVQADRFQELIGSLGEAYTVPQ